MRLDLKQKRYLQKNVIKKHEKIFNDLECVLLIIAFLDCFCKNWFLNVSIQTTFSQKLYINESEFF